MHKPDIAILMAGCLFLVCPCAATAKNPQPPSTMQASENTTKPATGDSPATRSKVGKRLDQPRNATSVAPRAPSKSSLHKLDEKNLGLGCAQP